MNLYDQIQSTAAYLKTKLSDLSADLAIITGTGIFIEAEIKQEIPYHEIPGFPSSTVSSHKGVLQLAMIGNKQVIILSGRWHYYEGYSTKEITFPIRVLKALGIESLIMSNVSGGLNPNFNAGDIITLEDHIYLLPENPLRGQNDDRLGVRFVDMIAPYSPSLRQATKRAMKKLELDYKEGTYVCIPGPSLETRAEYRYFHQIGADLIGMSTIPEVLVARHSEMEVLVLSIVSNECHPDKAISETTIEEVIAVANNSVPRLNKVITSIIESL